MFKIKNKKNNKQKTICDVVDRPKTIFDTILRLHDREGSFELQYQSRKKNVRNCPPGPPRPVPHVPRTPIKISRTHLQNRQEVCWFDIANESVQFSSVLPCAEQITGCARKTYIYIYIRKTPSQRQIP